MTHEEAFAQLETRLRSRLSASFLSEPWHTASTNDQQQLLNWLLEAVAEYVKAQL